VASAVDRAARAVLVRIGSVGFSVKRLFAVR